jgi:hypothetical protein
VTVRRGESASVDSFTDTLHTAFDVLTSIYPANADGAPGSEEGTPGTSSKKVYNSPTVRKIRTLIKEDKKKNKLDELATAINEAANTLGALESISKESPLIRQLISPIQHRMYRQWGETDDVFAERVAAEILNEISNVSNEEEGRPSAEHGTTAQRLVFKTPPPDHRRSQPTTSRWY